MKVRKILTLLLAILMLLSVSSFAYNGDGWSIDLSENDYEILKQDGITLFQKINGDNIVVQKAEQQIFGGKLTQFQLNSLTEQVKKQYQQTYNGATVEEIGRDEITINEYNVTRLKYKVELNGKNFYQDMNVFITEKNLFEVIFTTFTDDGFSDAEKTTILNSFKISDDIKNTDNVDNKDNKDNTNKNDNSVKEDNEVLFQILLLVLLAVAIIVIIIVSVIQSKKKKKAKAEVKDNSIKEDKKD